MPIKLLVFFFIMIGLVYGDHQLVVVITEDMNSTTGILKRYEKQGNTYTKFGTPISVMLGRGGLGWGDRTNELKMEGDGKSPAGIFPIRMTFGYGPEPIGAMSHYHADEKLICIDDVNDSRYNQIIQLVGEHPKSFEWMRREDGVYRYGAVIGYNEQGSAGRGSCIFFHLNHPDKRPTSGCTAMEETDLKELLKWLNPQKNPKLLQIPRSECSNYQKEFVGIECE